MPPLAVTRLAAADRPPRSLLLLHGIYGRGRNWQAIGRALTRARPEYACWLVDLPRHGDSGPGVHGDTVRGAAAELDDWVRAEGLEPDAVLGHSYGGKVALAWLGGRPDASVQAWIIDSSPAPSAPSGSAWHMLQVVRALPTRFSSREEATEGIVAGGFSLPVAQWMTTNLAREGDHFVWRLDFDAMERLLRDFFEADLWHAVEDPGPRHTLHFLKASGSTVMTSETVARIRAAPQGRVHLHERAGGHWIHAESPDVVADLLTEHLP